MTVPVVYSMMPDWKMSTRSPAYPPVAVLSRLSGPITVSFWSAMLIFLALFSLIPLATIAKKDAFA